MIVAFGALSPVSGRDCPAQGDWNAWCDCMFGVEDAATNTKCKNWMPGAPWTDVGAMLRGIPKANAAGVVTSSNTGGAGGFLSTLTGLFSGGSAASAQQGPVSGGASSVMSLPKTIAMIGGAVLVGGLAYRALKKRSRK